jgi:hypothetical protein
MSISKHTVKFIRFHRDETMTVALGDGRKINVPLMWYPRLAKAKPAARRNWEISGAGIGIHWPMIDEDLSIEGILRGTPSTEYKKPRRSGNVSHETRPHI